MELVHTARYKINLLFSVFLSGTVTGLFLVIMPFIMEGFSGNIQGASAAGIFVVFHLFLTRKYRKRKKIIHSEFPSDWEDILLEHVHFFQALNNDDRNYFRKKIQIFLTEKSVTGIGVEIDDRTRLLVAAAAIIPIFRIEDWEYDKIDEILIYPDSFDSSFNTEGDDRDVLGMVIQNTSSVIISHRALLGGFARLEGHNTAIHEFLHKIDEEDGSIDGLPALMLSRDEAIKWKEIVSCEMNRMENGKSDFNPYGLTNEAEFFAVAGEYFFEKPLEMKEKHIGLYRLMMKAFHQDEKTIIKDEIRRAVGRDGKKLGRNAPCHCGSGKKYKKCCMDKK